jgi:hypothetical protein
MQALRADTRHLLTNKEETLENETMKIENRNKALAATRVTHKRCFSKLYP